MMRPTLMNILAEDFNVKALTAIQQLSAKYLSLRFFFAGVNKYTDGLPEVATIITEGIDKALLKSINTEFNDLLAKEGIYYRICDSLVIESAITFDKAWVNYEGPHFYIQGGNFYTNSDD